MSLASDRDILIDAVREAGQIARDYFQTDVKQWQKSKNDPVTEADLAIDALLKDRLMQARPDYGWMSEESTDDLSRLDRSSVWIVDPIDGTRAFVKGRPHFTICAALVEDGTSVVGVVYNPVSDDLFEAVRGQGARRNGQPMKASQTPDIENCRMLGSEDLFRHPKWKRTWPEMTIKAMNSIALRMVLAASGEWDACMALNGKSDWDLAAADVITTEAGARCTDYQGRTFTYNQESTRQSSVVVANPVLHDKLIERVAHLKLPGR